MLRRNLTVPLAAVAGALTVMPADSCRSASARPSRSSTTARPICKILERLARSLDDGVEVETFDRAEGARSPRRATAARSRHHRFQDARSSTASSSSAASARIPACADVPIIVGHRVRRIASCGSQALEAGATDFLLEPGRSPRIPRALAQSADPAPPAAAAEGARLLARGADDRRASAATATRCARATSC